MYYCDVCSNNELDKVYHDDEWGRPVFDDYIQFEYLSLEVMQCGLSWALMLKKRKLFKELFDNFDFNKIANYSEEDINRILTSKEMIHSINKIKAIINNAKKFIDIRNEHGSFSSFIWNFSDNKVLIYTNHKKDKMPASNGLSKKIALTLKKKGFKFLGEVVVYSHLQAIGLINDHNKDCFVYKFVIENYPIKFIRDYKEKF